MSITQLSLSWKIETNNFMNSLETFFITLKLLITPNNNVGTPVVVNGCVFEQILLKSSLLKSSILTKIAILNQLSPTVTP